MVFVLKPERKNAMKKIGLFFFLSLVMCLSCFGVVLADDDKELGTGINAKEDIETYLLTVTCNKGGIVYGGNVCIPVGEQVEIVVIPDDGYVLKHRTAINVSDDLEETVFGLEGRITFRGELNTEAEGCINIFFELKDNSSSWESDDDFSYVEPEEDKTGHEYLEEGILLLTFGEKASTALADIMDRNGYIEFNLANEEESFEGLKGAVLEINLKKLLEECGDGLKKITFDLNGNKVEYPIEMLKELVKQFEIVKFKLFEGSFEISLFDEMDMVIEYNSQYRPVLVKIPYTPLENENTDYIVMYDKNDKEEGIIPSSYYIDGYVHAFVYSANGYFGVKYINEEGYSDTIGHWGETAINYMSARNIMPGVGNNTFNHSGTLTKAEYITMLIRCFNIMPYGMDNVEPFNDSDKIPSWAEEYALYAKSLGMSITDAMGNFDPLEPISREDMFLVTYEAMNLSGMLPEAMTTEYIVFLDGDDVKREAIGAVQTLVKLNIINGNSDGSLNPKGYSSRGEVAQFLYNFLQYAKQ